MKTAKLGTAGATTYLYNALGQRAKKSGGGATTTFFVYDEAGHLVGEYNSTGAVTQEIVWLGDIPIATLRSGSVYYIHTDQLNTPRKITSSAASPQLKWKWDPTPFGEGAPSEPNGAFKFNLRFPGQYFDSESNLNYNYFRDYDPAKGGYAEPDPIGLSSGSLSTYSFVQNSPIGLVDPNGLQVTTVDAYCLRYPSACAEVVSTQGIRNGVRGIGSAIGTAVGVTTLLRQPCPEDCGPDTRIEAEIKAAAWAGTDIVMADWTPVPWSQYGGRGGTNYSYVRGQGANNYGYTSPKPGSRAGIFNHPDGHPDQVGKGFPDHHKCPHFHAVNAAGAEQIFIYKRGT